MTLDLYSSFTSLVIDRPVDGVLRLTMNRPEKLNSLDADGHQQLADIWRVIDRDTETRAVLLCGKGKAFSAGGDFEVAKKLTESAQERAKMWREARDLVYNMINCSKPIVSAINGSAVGAGLAAALMSDIPIATKKAKLIDGHVRLGVAAGDHAAMIWPLLCGMAKAKYHLLLNEPVTGEMAERLGIVALAVEDDELEEKSLEVVTRLSQGSPSAIQWTKYALNNWLRMAGPTFDASLALEMLGFASEEPIEGLASFSEKRPPNFSKKSGI
jgi:enoyl-CoA hydratase